MKTINKRNGGEVSSIHPLLARMESKPLNLFSAKEIGRSIMDWLEDNTGVLPRPIEKEIEARTLNYMDAATKRDEASKRHAKKGTWSNFEIGEDVEVADFIKKNWRLIREHADLNVLAGMIVERFAKVNPTESYGKEHIEEILKMFAPVLGK